MLLWVAVWFGMVHFFTSLGPPGSISYLLSIPGILMGYGAVTRFVNRTVIDITADEIVLRHEPLPWPGKRRFSTEDVQGLFAGIKKIRGKGYTVDECWIFLLRSHSNQIKKIMLLKGLGMSESEMVEIAAAISQYLGVPLL